MLQITCCQEITKIYNFLLYFCKILNLWLQNRVAASLSSRKKHKSDIAKKANLASLKSVVDKLDIDKLEKVPNDLSSLKSKVDELDVDTLTPVSVDLGKLCDVVRINVMKKVKYGELVKKINSIKITDTDDLVQKS